MLARVELGQTVSKEQSRQRRTRAGGNLIGNGLQAEQQPEVRHHLGKGFSGVSLSWFMEMVA